MYDIYVRNFVFGSRGPMSAVMVRHKDQPTTILIGTVFFLEVGGDNVVSAAQAQKWCEDNAGLLHSSLQDLEDDGIVPGWSGRPWTEQAMISKAVEEAGWN